MGGKGAWQGVGRACGDCLPGEPGEVVMGRRQGQGLLVEQLQGSVQKRETEAETGSDQPWLPLSQDTVTPGPLHPALHHPKGSILHLLQSCWRQDPTATARLSQHLASPGHPCILSYPPLPCVPPTQQTKASPAGCTGGQQQRKQRREHWEEHHKLPSRRQEEHSTGSCPHDITQTTLGVCGCRPVWEAS